MKIAKADSRWTSIAWEKRSHISGRSWQSCPPSGNWPRRRVSRFLWKSINEISQSIREARKARIKAAIALQLFMKFCLPFLLSLFAHLILRYTHHHISISFFKKISDHRPARNRPCPRGSARGIDRARGPARAWWSPPEGDTRFFSLVRVYLLILIFVYTYLAPRCLCMY